MKILKTTLSSLAASLLILGLLTQITYAQEAVPDGTLDLGFDPNADENVTVIAVQADGKILIGGDFNMIGTGAQAETRTRIARLDTDGTLDESFNVVNVDDDVLAIAVQTDGKIILGGFFTEVDSEPRNLVARLESNGDLDMSFDPNIDASIIESISLQMDQNVEKILIAGTFAYTLDGVERNNLARLNPADGSFDTSFTPNIDGGLFSAVVAPDNKILVSGQFANIDGMAHSDVARLNFNGTLDDSFNSPVINMLPGNGGGVTELLIQPDGRILVAGQFNNVGGNNLDSIARLDTFGNFDMSFDPIDATILSSGVVTNTINDLQLQADGKILLGGGFSYTDEGVTASNLARFNGDGSIDLSLNSFFSNAVILSVALQPADDNIIIGGAFDAVNGEPRNHIARLANSIPRPEIGFSNTTQNQQEGNTDDDPTIFTFQVTNVLPEGAVDVASSVSYAVSGSGANPANAEDFVGGEFPTGTLNFANSNSNDTITIEIARDADIEENETFTITLSNQNPNTTTLTTATAQGTILDDDEEDDILCLPIPANNGNFAVICL